MYDWSEEHYNLCLCHGVTTSLILSNRWSQVVAMTTSWLSGPSGLTITWRGESTCPRSSTVWVLTARVGDSWSRYVPCSEKHHGSSATAVTDHNWLSLFQIFGDGTSIWVGGWGGCSDPVSLLQSHQLSVVVLYTWVLGFKNKWWLWSWAVSESDEKIDQRRWKPANISSYHWQSLILSLFPDKYKDCLLPNITIIKTFLSGVCVCLHRNTSELMIYHFKAFSLWPTGFFSCTFTFYISYKIKNKD